MKKLLHFYHRIINAIIVDHARRTEARFEDIERLIESGLIHLRTSSQKSLGAETHALHVRINHIEAELKRQLEAVVFLSNTKRDSQGLRGTHVPELLQ